MIWTEKVHAVLCLSLSAALTASSPTPARAGMGAAELITPAQAQAIYRRLIETHWVPQTGLFESFPDSADRKLSQQASLYEQGAMGLLAIRLGDFDRAQTLFHFLKEAWESAAEKPERHGQRGLVNFYNAEFGSEGIEKTVHAGPNAWAGLFAARLANATHDGQAQQWALDVAYWMANAIPHQNGALAMGTADQPGGAPWAHIFSTENNLSYYAFLTELLRSASIEKDQRLWITQERDHVENWIVNTAVNRHTGRTLRGVSPTGQDGIQALDTYTWMISAVGPQRLAARGVDPHQVMSQAAALFEVTLGDAEGVDPADQSEADFVFLHDHAQNGQAVRPAENRHRMIWYEGLGQYILALSTMADYSNHTGRPELAAAYLQKAERLTRQFDRQALRKENHALAYFYATPGRFFRDGWRTPTHAAEGPASSLIAGVWRCFAGLGMDPLAGRDIGVVRGVAVSVPKNIRLAERRPAILYGASEEMTTQAWRALNSRHWDQAIEQAQAVIDEWSPWALQLQARKNTEIGHLIEYSGQEQEKNTVFKYWALNDVGAAYFVLGKALDEKQDYPSAARALQQIVDHYSLAQIWDPQGWFWSPVEAIRNDFVLRDPAHYSRVVAELIETEPLSN